MSKARNGSPCRLVRGKHKCWLHNWKYGYGLCNQPRRDAWLSRRSATWCFHLQLQHPMVCPSSLTESRKRQRAWPQLGPAFLVTRATALRVCHGEKKTPSKRATWSRVCPLWAQCIVFSMLLTPLLCFPWDFALSLSVRWAI